MKKGFFVVFAVIFCTSAHSLPEGFTDQLSGGEIDGLWAVLGISSEPLPVESIQEDQST